MTIEQWDEFVQRLGREWGGPVAVDVFAPSLAADAAGRSAYANYLRQAASPGAAIDIMSMNGEIDVSAALPAIRVPTLIVHRAGDRLIEIAQARYLAAHIRDAQLRELAGEDHTWIAGDGDAIVDEIELFLTGTRRDVEPDRVLATVLFTDIVGSTERAASIGDRHWRDLLEQHRAMVRRKLGEFRGREIDTAGDGFLVAFDGPGRAVRCAGAIAADAAGLGLEVRAGLHAGECELMGDKLSGLTIHIAARVAALASPGEVLVSSTVKDLVAGSGLRFAERGSSVLKGVPGTWQIYSLQH